MTVRVDPFCHIDKNLIDDNAVMNKLVIQNWNINIQKFQLINLIEMVEAKNTQCQQLLTKIDDIGVFSSKTEIGIIPPSARKWQMDMPNG
ncbi:hypothetical protein M2R47_07565 [Moraxella sp. Tifton1]|uniref:hypothetical protein n=1 Tax=Moraxella oculi TaxID=2940516 RepID=UPI0020133C8B|nr:hypothetical protein [Moraxella sp. Tifton1]MCL1624095.1 hypothetical protein [Moraxella sp. Tifton1]